MLTIFTIPKPFAEDFNVIQRNAIQSWIKVYPDCEIVLFGDELGTSEIAREFKVEHIPYVKCNEYGTPLVDSMFEQIQQVAKYDLLCYINSDIILMKDFADTLRRIRFKRFLVIGQRWDLDLKEALDFASPDWEKRLRRLVSEHGKLHPPWGSDYFVFLRDRNVLKLPPFAVGRTIYDNWLIWWARSLNMPVIDATRTITCIHQNHVRTYSSIKKQTVEGVDNLRESVEAQINYALAGNARIFILLDATHIITPRLILPAFEVKYLIRHLETQPILFPERHIRNLFFKIIARLGLMIYHFWKSKKSARPTSLKSLF